MENRERVVNIPEGHYNELTIVEERPDRLETGSVSSQQVVLRDRVRWGPIWAGLVSTLSIFLMLQLLSYAIGLERIGIDPNVGVGVREAVISTIIGLASFFFGAWIATATSFVRGAGAGVLNGFFIWALSFVLIILFSSLGLGVAFGSAGSALGQFFIFTRGGIAVPGIDLARAADVAREASWWAFFILALSAGASILGGWLGSRGRPVGRVAVGQVSYAR